jgi:NADH:ubiquinone oxidoreductase subunit 6 (subunit J)
MYAELQAVVLSAALIGTAGFALFSSKVSSSLIALFYASVLLGLMFAFSGDSLLGLVQMTTFAGAVSVLTLAVILLTGESKLSFGASRLGLAAGAGAVVFAGGAVAILGGLGGASPTSYSDVSSLMFAFLWEYRPWDLLILVMAFASAMITITNLLSRET